MRIEDLDLDDDVELGLSLDLRAARHHTEARVLRQALARTGANVSEAAKLLGISRPALYDLMFEHGLEANTPIT